STPYTFITNSFTPDGHALILGASTPQRAQQLAMLPLDGKQNPVSVDGAGPQGVVSPDGRWIAYVNSASGRSEIYVRPFPGPGVAPRVQTAGGNEPVWAPNGHELFFRRDSALLAAEVISAGGTFSVGPSRELFKGPYLIGGVRPGYDVAPDGKRFLLVKASGAQVDPTRFSIVMNWLDEMTARLSTR